MNIQRLFFIVVSLSWLTACPIFPEYVKLVSTSPTLKPLERPLARVNNSYVLTNVGDEVSLDASSSIAHDENNNLKHHWVITQKPTQSQLKIISPSHPVQKLKIDAQGTYELTLSVTDSAELQDSTSVLISTTAERLPSVSFLALGDFGKGNKEQFAVGKAMAALCNKVSCDFVTGLGDNIYPSGVNTRSDQQFYKKFEKPFAALEMPFYHVLGNHDTSGLFYQGSGVLNFRGDLQIAYARRPSADNIKWQMPARYYQFEAPIASSVSPPLVNFFALDSAMLTTVLDVEKNYNAQESLEQQTYWLKQRLTRSNATWNIAFAHHPYLSNGTHGNAGAYEDINLDDTESTNGVDRVLGKWWKTFVESNLCNQVDWFLAGHDHNLQYLESPPNCTNTRLIVSGAGAQVKPLSGANRNPSIWQTDKAPGFFRIEIIGNHARVWGYEVNTDGKYTETLVADIIK